MANDTAPFDGLFPASLSIDSLILGTGDDDVLSAQADGNIVLGFEGGDRLNSTFNLTALIGGDGEDTLTTNVIVPLQSDARARNCHSVGRNRQRQPRCDGHSAGQWN